MGRNGKFVPFLLLLIVSDASLFGSSRKLVDEEAPKDDSPTKQNSPSPGPLPDTKSLSDLRPTGDEKSNTKSRESQSPNTNSSISDPNGLDKSNSTNSPPPMQPGNDKNGTEVINRTETTSPPPLEQKGREENKKGSDETKPLGPPPSGHPPPMSTGSRKNGTELDKESPPSAKLPGEGNDDKGKSRAGNDDTDKSQAGNDDKGKSQSGNDDKGKSRAGSVETCPGTSNMCRDENSLVACTLSVEKGSAKWMILVQNEGDGPLEANIILPASIGRPFKELTIPKHQSQRVNISIVGDTEKIIVDAGHGECVLHMEPLVSEGSNIFIHFPSYEKLVTPINGAYLLIVSVVVFGLAWACCLCRKKRRGDGIPYQELEMGTSEAQSARDIETAEGWDEGWDDDWDEISAVKSPGGGLNVKNNISANGLTARTSNRDGWENDWDD